MAMERGMLQWGATLWRWLGTLVSGPYNQRLVAYGMMLIFVAIVTIGVITLVGDPLRSEYYRQILRSLSLLP